MKKSLAAALLVALAAAALPVYRSVAGPVGPTGDYRRVLLLSWDGVRRDVLHELLERTDPLVPCWEEGDVFPMPTGRTDGGGNPLYTCLPALAGVKPSDAPADSPAYAPFQVIASHTTNDGVTVTKPQHASMLSGYDATHHGLTMNVSSTRMPQGAIVYERLMDAFDPVGIDGRRNGFVLRTHHSASRKFAGSSLYYWAKRSRALQVATGNGNEADGAPGPLKYAAASFAKWRAEAVVRGLEDPAFFLFLHFKSPDWAGHLSGDKSKQYRQAIVATDRRLYTLLEMLRSYGWSDAAVLVTTDHGFAGIHHGRDAGRIVFNTWIAAHNVHLTTDHVPIRDEAAYCASHQDPAACLADGPEIPMPPEDAVPNVLVTFVVPTILDMFGVEWRDTSEIDGDSLYVP